MAHDVADYEAILNGQWEDVPQVKLLPLGNWEIEVKNASFLPPKKEGNSPTVLFYLLPKRPTDDVDGEELDALGEDYDLDQNQIAHSQWVSNARDWASVKRMLTVFGVDVTQGTIKDQLAAAKGLRAIAFIDQREYTNNAGDSVVENTAKHFKALDD